MVLVDIFVPSVDKTYNFSLNENIAVHTIIDEIEEMIAQKEQTILRGESSAMELWLKETKSMLSREHTLAENGVKTGCFLILV